MMISVQVVERSVIINDNSPLQNYTHPNDQFTLSHVFVFVFHYFFTFVYDSLASFISILMVFIRDLVSMESLKHQFWESSINLSHWNIICCLEVSVEIQRDVFDEWMFKLVKEQVKLYLIWSVTRPLNRVTNTEGLSAFEVHIENSKISSPTTIKLDVILNCILTLCL